MHARAFPVHSIAANSPKRKNCILLAYVTGTTRPIGKYFRCDVFRTNFYWGLNNTLKKVKRETNERQTLPSNAGHKALKGSTEIVTNYARDEKKAAQSPSELQRMRAHKSQREELSYK